MTANVSKRCRSCGSTLPYYLANPFATCANCREMIALGMTLPQPDCRWCGKPVEPGTGEYNTHDYCGSRTD